MDSPDVQAPEPGKEPAALLSLAKRLLRAAGRGALATVTLAALLFVGGTLGALIFKPIFAFVAWVWINAWPN